MAMEAQPGLTLFNAIATAGRTIYELAQSASSSDTKRQMMDVYDTLMNLKRDAPDLEDQNRELKEKLRFRSDDFEFKNPYWFDKSHPDRALCPKCFADEIVAPVSKPNSNQSGTSRRCLHCGDVFWEVRRAPSAPSSYGGGPPPTQWS
jgi:uncharacterized protein with PIN domain